MDSPCIGICEIDPRNQECKGCYRTLDEIAGWTAIPDDERQTVIQRVVTQQFDEKEE